MFKIQDGRDCFWQWDINRYLVIEDSSIKQVHFCNRTNDYSLVCPVIEQDGELVARVPNILLQNSWPINVYGYDKEYTKHSKTFKVNSRTRPEDYVYQEEEVKLWSELEQRIINLEENGISDEVIAQKIADYFVINPIPEPDLTDYATKVYVDNAVGSVDIPDVSGFITEDELNAKGYLTEHQSLEGYAKLTDIPEPQDLSGYALKTEIPDVSSFITAIPDEYVTETELNAKGYLTEHQSLEGYAKTTDIPDVSGYQTEAQVNALIQAAMPPSGDEVSY